MLNTQALHAEILVVMPDIRRAVAKALRYSRYYSDDNVDECMSDIMLQIFDYGVRTFDASKGTVKAHFTSFAFKRAINWLHMAFRRHEVSEMALPTEDGETVTEQFPTEGNPHISFARAQEAQRIRAAIASLEPRQRALLEAFERTACWSKAAKEIGVSTPTASRMKAQIAEQLR